MPGCDTLDLAPLESLPAGIAWLGLTHLQKPSQLQYILRLFVCCAVSGTSVLSCTVCIRSGCNACESAQN